MAIWQFTFHLVPRDAVERLHGASILVLGSYRPVDLDTWDEEKEHPNYWDARIPSSYAQVINTLLAPRKSWSDDALMFGDEDGDSIELWPDDIRVRIDVRAFDASLARAVVDVAAADDLMLVMAETGRMISPDYDKLSRELRRSRAAKFVTNPIETLRMIGREQE